MTNEQGIRIDVKDVTIETLTISPDTLTLSTYIQLDDRFPREEDEPIHIWGRVSYHPDDCQDKPKHVHIAWQKEHTLYRATIYEDGWPNGYGDPDLLNEGMDHVLRIKAWRKQFWDSAQSAHHLFIAV